jgi:hypothetical protein
VIKPEILKISPKEVGGDVDTWIGGLVHRLPPPPQGAPKKKKFKSDVYLADGH